MDNTKKIQEVLRELADAEKRVDTLRWELQRLVELEKSKESGG